MLCLSYLWKFLKSFTWKIIILGNPISFAFLREYRDALDIVRHRPDAIDTSGNRQSLLTTLYPMLCLATSVIGNPTTVVASDWHICFMFQPPCFRWSSRSRFSWLKFLLESILTYSTKISNHNFKVYNSQSHTKLREMILNQLKLNIKYTMPQCHDMKSYRGLWSKGQRILYYGTR
jgi:hypothetical protein